MSSREKVIAYLKLGKSNKEIAELCNVSVRTVERYKKEFTTNDSDKKSDKRQSKKIAEKKKEDTLIEEIEEEDGLTDKQRLFCYYYIQSFNAYQSAIKAGYSKSYAQGRVYDMLGNVRIKTFLNKLKEEQKAELLVSQEKILNRHSQIAFSDITEYINPDGTLKEDIDGTLIKKITVKSSKSEDDNGYKESSTVSIEMEDRKESLKFLTKYLGLEDEKNEEEDNILQIEVLD